MAYSTPHIQQLTDLRQCPYHLLELADPSRAQIDAYLATGTCHVAIHDDTIVGVLVLDEIDATRLEVKNIAVAPTEQGKGLGKRLLAYASVLAREDGYKTLVIGTGNSSIGQLTLYQKVGFELVRIEKDYFVKHYPEPIIENGIPCRHKLVLEKAVG